MGTLESFLAHYGLAALFLIATVEGDVSLLVAGVMAHLGLLPLTGTILAGAAGNLAGDTVWFLLGRRHSERIRQSRFYWAVGHRIESLARRLGPWQLLAARVVYGTRNASMVFWGQYGLSLLRFLAFDLLGCLTAATGFVLLGYLVGHGTAALAGELRRIEHWLLLAVVAAVAIVAGISRLTRRELER